MQSHYSDGYRNPALQNGVRCITYTSAHAQLHWAQQILAITYVAADSRQGSKQLCRELLRDNHVHDWSERLPPCVQALISRLT